MRDVPARNQAVFLAEIESAKRHFGLPEEAPVFSCYEAGRDASACRRGSQSSACEPRSRSEPRRAFAPRSDRPDSGEGQGSGGSSFLSLR